MEESRINPDVLLSAIKDKDNAKRRGKLKIFFGYAAGVGKTYSMLQAAHTMKEKGIDVVVGYIEPHARPQTLALLDGLECLKCMDINYHNITYKEFDIDNALKRKPELILIDELAHTNANICRHKKRYQDLNEILNAGIDVYATINVQHIESLNDMVASITGIMVKERIPDKVFDDADQVELVDIEPQDLIERFNSGQIYQGAHAEKALLNFFSIENLIALREISLRRCADRVNKISEYERLKSNGKYYTEEHILVCLSTSPTNAKIIRTASRMAHAFNAKFTALFVESSSFNDLRQEDKERLRFHINLAKQLGASIELAYGDDIALQISEYARLSSVSKIVVGRNNARRKYFAFKYTLIERLIALSPNLDVYIIPDKEYVHSKIKMNKRNKKTFTWKDTIKSFIVLLISTLIGIVFSELGYSEANIITVYILGVLITAVITTHRIYSLISSVLSVLVFNFLFTLPTFSLTAYDSGYPTTFLIMFIAAFITGTLAEKIKQHASQSAQTAYRMKILFDTNIMLQQAKEEYNIISITANQLNKLLDKDVVFYMSQGEILSKPFVFSISDEDKNYINDNERAVAAWVSKNNKRAGATTDTLSQSKCLYHAVRINDVVYGVLGIEMKDDQLDIFETSILLSMLGECALALENKKASKEKEEAAILAKNEQLRANLLRSISHDLRTPLTSISGNAGILLTSENSLDFNKKKQLYQDIYDDSLWLINLVENLLSVTRIEDGTMQLNKSAQLVEEIINEALQHIRDRKDHNIKIEMEDELILAKMDARLIMQVIINIVDNAIKYTPANSDIIICAKRQIDMVLISIKDNGDGLDEESKLRVFDMFYTGSKIVMDSRRSLGLGLALCKSIILAHNGEICVKDNIPKGSIFEFTLPIEEVVIHE